MKAVLWKQCLPNIVFPPIVRFLFKHSFIFPRPKYDLMRDQCYKLVRIYLAKPMMGEMLHSYLIIINNYLITKMLTRSHWTQAKLPLKRVTGDDE